MMKSANYVLALVAVLCVTACANNEKQSNSAATTAAMEAAAVQLANDMCSAKQSVANAPADPQKLEEYEKKSAELNRRLADLESEYSGEEQRKKLTELISNMTANCVVKKDTLQ